MVQMIQKINSKEQNMNKIWKSMLALTMVAVTMLPNTAFAATHDTIEDNSSDTATITVGKVLTVNQGGKFPSLSDYRFSIEAVKGWDNANVLATENGKAISAGDMPMPSNSNTSHHTVTVSGTDADILVGDFLGATNTNRADTDTSKLRTTDLNIRFSKAGYYMYRISEQYDAANKIPGVTYDDNDYYVLVYVCNKTDENGNTIDGVYVHDITSFRNDPESDKQPDLSDIANVTDNGGVAAVENTYENFDKVGKSENTPGTDPETGIPTGPNKLEAYKFWNSQATHDVVVTNNVTGNLGDRTKEFEFEVKLSGLEKGATYTTDVDAAEKTEKKHTSADVEMIEGAKGSVNAQARTFTADESGECVFTVKLKDDEVFVMNALPATSKYQITEGATDHIASYGISSTREDTAVISNTSAANNKDNTTLATAVETVDGAGADEDDGTVTVAFNNLRNIATITGVPYYGNSAFIMGMFLALCALMAVTYKRHGRYSMEDGE